MRRAGRVATIALLGALIAWSASLAWRAPDARAGYIYMTSCSRMGDNAEDTDVDGLVWKATGSRVFALFNRCPQNGSFQIEGTDFAKKGAAAQWTSTAPPSIQIIHAWTPTDHVLISPKAKSDGYAARFTWAGGSKGISPLSACCGGMDYATTINRWIGPSQYFAFQVRCANAPCTPPHGQLLDVNAIELVGKDATPPRLSALGSNNIWYQASHWIRGTWPASFQATDNAGVCAMRAVIDGQVVQGPSDPHPNRHSWTQCPTPSTMTLSIDTSRYPDGTLPLQLIATDATAPANASSPAESLHVDNQPVNLRLSGPTDAPTTAGTQYVTASAAAGPSGVAGIACSVNGAGYIWYPAASARIPVQGVGRHNVVCYAQNRSVDSSGLPASSPAATWTLTIRQPTVFAMGFARVADKMRCRRVRVHVKVPGRWVTIRYHHKRVRVRTRSRWTRTTETRCHARMVRRRITVWSTTIQNGHVVRVKHTRVVRVAVAPHVVMRTHRRIDHGKSTMVSGWLGTAEGHALGGERVLVLSAPDNGLGHFRVVAWVTTRPNGAWSTRLQPGPSRLIEAAYTGGATTEPATSAQIRLTVPARVRLHITPRRTHWGGTIKISGRVLGGYIPQGKLLRLRIGADGVFGTVGIPDVRPDGRFSTTWTFASGRGTVRYWFSVSTLREADYPYAPANSRRVRVTVGP
jgi:hypothetical protein